MSLRVDLDEGNMDLVMFLVRKLDKKPYEVINQLLNNPFLVEEARSELHGKIKKEDGAGEKQCSLQVPSK